MSAWKPNARSRVVLQVSPFSCAGAGPAHSGPNVIQNGWCITFCLLVEEYLQVGCVDVAQSVLRESRHQMPAKNIPVEIACGLPIGGKHSLFPPSGEVSEQHS